MARITDDTKINRIRSSAMQRVVERGYGGASISEIAGSAGVAEGYLYRYYRSKADLVNDLFRSNLEELAAQMERIIQNSASVHEIVGGILSTLLTLTRETPDRIKFMYVLMHDYNFSIPDALRDRIFGLCRMVKEKGWNTGEITGDISEENIYLLGVAYPISFINSRLKSLFYNSSLDETDLDRVSQLIIKSWKD